MFSYRLCKIGPLIEERWCAESSTSKFVDNRVFFAEGEVSDIDISELECTSIEVRGGGGFMGRLSGRDTLDRLLSWL